MAVRARNLVVRERVSEGKLTLHAFIQEPPTRGLFARLAAEGPLRETIDWIEKEFILVENVEVVVLRKKISPLAYIRLNGGQELAGTCHHPWDSDLPQTALSASVNSKRSVDAVNKLLRSNRTGLKACGLWALAGPDKP